MFVDLFIDFKNKKVINVLPYSIHCDGFMYPEMEQMIHDGDGVIISINEEELEILDKDGLISGWKDIEYIQKSGKNNLYENKWTNFILNK